MKVADMFAGCVALRGGEGTRVRPGHESDKAYIRIDGADSLPGYFTDRTKPPKTAKAVVEDDGRTLRFVFNDTEYAGKEGVAWFSVADAELIAATSALMPPWSGCVACERVVFAPSFADYEPSQCLRWFVGLSGLPSPVLRLLVLQLAAAGVH